MRDPLACPKQSRMGTVVNLHFISVDKCDSLSLQNETCGAGYSLGVCALFLLILSIY